MNKGVLAMQYVIETKRLCKTYGGRTVVHNLDLHVPQAVSYTHLTLPTTERV